MTLRAVLDEFAAPLGATVVVVAAVSLFWTIDALTNRCTDRVLFIEPTRPAYDCGRGATASVEVVDGKLAVACRCGGKR